MVAETNENRRMGQKLERKIVRLLGALYLTKLSDVMAQAALVHPSYLIP